MKLTSSMVLKIGIIAVAVSVLSIYLLDQMHIDRCLDSGGSIDYDLFRCDLMESHPKAAYLESRWQRYVLPIVGLVGWFLLAKLIQDRTDD